LNVREAKEKEAFWHFPLATYRVYLISLPRQRKKEINFIVTTKGFIDFCVLNEINFLFLSLTATAVHLPNEKKEEEGEQIVRLTITVIMTGLMGEKERKCYIRASIYLGI
jgi:hypothetical protein